MIFFAKLERLAVGVRDKFSGGKARPKGERAKARVVFSACVHEISHELGIKFFATRAKRLKFRRALLQ